MAKRQSIATAINQIKNNAPKMFSQIAELAKSELKPAAKNAGLGAGIIGAVAVIGSVALLIALLTIGFALSIIYNQAIGMSAVTSLTLGFLTLFILSLIIVVLLVLLALRFFKKVQSPKATIAETKASLSAIGTAISTGMNKDSRSDPLKRALDE
ncbi:phage holin family protein [Propionimicrobium lymphophilum]|uniref:phage holin family protein n=1 Tax=Propionimicrobium lymphophilum TaxID=33012 RepID=UPI003EC60F55